MTGRLLTSGLIAGFGAGLVAAMLQLAFVQPLMVEAELYETGARVHAASAGPHDHGGAPIAPQTTADDHAHLPGAAAHSHEPARAATGSPETRGVDWQRNGLTVLFFGLTYAGFGVLLVCGMALADRQGHRARGQDGALWGLAGFAAMQFAPAFGLPPELPGMAAGDLMARQAWWAATAAATAGGLWVLAFGRGPAGIAAGLLLIAVTHLIGAPQPPGYAGPTPPELAGLFTARALGVGLVAWICLGLLAARLWQGGGQASRAAA